MMSEIKPTVSSGRKFSAIWILPLVTLVVGVSIVIHSIMTEGPTITIDFATADDLEVGKTKVKLLSVVVGVVENIVIKKDLSGVTVTMQIDQKAEHLLREDTRFWVVRARVGAGGVSGLGTLLAGAYIEMAPGDSSKEQNEFIGLEEPPLTPADAPGLRLSLFSDRAGSVTAGNEVLYKGYPVGRVEAEKFDAERRQMRYEIFVDAPYHHLIGDATRFWNSSGISLEASAQGFKVDIGSLNTMLLGGVAFGSAPGMSAGSAVQHGEEYKLYDSYDDILKNPYKHGINYVVSFKQSLRGLAPGAPVEYRGITIGRVERLLLKELAATGPKGTGQAIPVLIYLEPGRLELGDNEKAVEGLKKVIAIGVANNGFRATLETGNLLTGSQLISLEYFPDEPPGELGEFEEYAVIPTIETGVARLTEQVSAFLEKLNGLPLEATLNGANESLASLTAAIDSANSLIDNEDARALPADLASTLSELRLVLAGFAQDSKMSQSLGASVNKMNIMLENLDTLIRKLSVKPNAIIFPISPESDPIPEAYPK